MSKLIDLTGQKFSRLMVMSRGPNDKQGKPRWWCLCDCGNGALIAGSCLKNKHTKSCGCLDRERAAEARRIWNRAVDQMREKNPNWNPNLTDEEREVGRRYPAYIDWRTQVFERDRYACQKCKTWAGYINAHHIEAFAGNKELRTELSNGITFCQVCHKDFHYQYGNNCTRKQLEEFMSEVDHG